MYRAIPDEEAVKERLARSAELQHSIWDQALEGARATGRSETTMLVVPALNQMIDITTTRTVALQTHPPRIVFGMLGILVWVCSLLAGFGIATRDRRHRLHELAFAGILSFTVFVILDYEYPRIGFVRINAADRVLIDLRDSLK